MKVAINWSYINVGTVIVDVPDNIDLDNLISTCELPSSLLANEGEFQIDEIVQIYNNVSDYENCERGKLFSKRILGLPYGYSLKLINKE